MQDYQTVIFEQEEDHVATLTLNRPEQMNAFNTRMMEEIKSVWQRAQADDGIHAIVLRASEGRAFCPGVDVREHRPPPSNVWRQQDPGYYLCPKLNECWKPVVTAVHGMCAGGAFYLINESDIVICSEDATFFDPHVTYGMTSALEPTGMTYRQPLGEVLRMALLGNDERVGAETALRTGIVSEITTREALWGRAHELAAKIATKPSVATQGTVRAIWESLDMPRTIAQRTGLKYCQIGNAIGIPLVDRPAVMKAAKDFKTR
jgi:enoyl-CoA hydratase/carnithine racemase